MDALDRRFAEDVTNAAHNMPESAVESAAQLVAHGSSAADAGADTSAMLLTEQVDATSSFARRVASALLAPRLVGRFCDFFGFVLLMYMVWRTCLYVKRRRKGMVGPAMAPILIKFWATFGLIEFGAHMLSLYLTPLKAVWFVSVLRALALAVLTWGRRLHLTVKLYDQKLVPFYDAQAPEIEKLFAQARKAGDELNDVFREYATYLLKRIEVGGLSGAMSDLNTEGDEIAGTQQAAEGGDGGRGRPGRALPQNTGVFKSGRQFFAGAAHERAEAVGNSSADSMRGVIQVASPEPPKAAYEDLRALRRKFRSRGVQIAKAKENLG